MPHLPQSLTRPILVLIALALLILPAAHPFLQGKMPLTDDGDIHLYRAIVLDHSLHFDGTLYPRYSSGLAYGYGAMLFNYFPPTSYYLTVFLHGLGASFTQAWLWTMILYLWIGACSAYLLGREWAGSSGGFLAAAAYCYSPYLLFDAVSRGTSSELAALSLLPLALWGFTRLAFRGRRQDFLAAVLSFCLMILMHTITTLQGTIMLAVYSAGLCWISPDKLRVLRQLVAAGCLAVILTAFFWLPALSEISTTQIDTAMKSYENIDVIHSLRGLAEVFALPRTADPTRLQAPTSISVGWLQFVLAWIGLVWIGFVRVSPGHRRDEVEWESRLRRSWRLLIVLMGFSAAMVFMQLPASAEVWKQIPLLHYSEFAWRLLGPLSLAVALMSAIGGMLLLQRIKPLPGKIAALAAMLAGIMVYGMPWLYGPYHTLQANSLTDAQAFERRSGAVALSSFGEYLPAGVDPASLNSEAMRSAFAGSDTPARLILPAGVRLLDATWRGTSAVIRVQADSAATLVFNWLYYPGWQARYLEDSSGLDPLIVRPLLPQGLVSVAIPAGTHTLEITRQNTPVQTASESISLAGLLLLAVVLWAGWRGIQPAAFAVPGTGFDALPAAEVVMGVGLALFLIKATLIDQMDTPLRVARFSGGVLAGDQHSMNTNFEGKIRLLGVSQPEKVPSGEDMTLAVYWTLAGDALDTDYSSVAHVRDSQQNIIAQAGSFYPGGLATHHWLAGYYLQEPIVIRIPAFTPPGIYTIDVGVFNPETQQALSVLNEEGNPVGVQAVLPAVEVIRPQSPLTGPLPPLANVNGLALLEVTGLPDQAQAGDPIPLAWVWQATTALSSDMAARLSWKDSAGAIVASTRLVPLVQEIPTTQWQAGDIWRGQHLFYVPGSLPAGQYQVWLQIGEARIALNKMAVTAPERRFDVPPLEHESRSTWENGIRLIGYTYDGTSVSLAWQAATQVDQSLRLFVQAVDAQGNIAALTDGVPVDWTRPTTSWAPGEVILTVHPFGDLPVGEYRVRVGWVDPITGQRILLTGGADALVLDTPLSVK